jgi:hypothetical protein
MEPDMSRDYEDDYGEDEEEDAEDREDSQIYPPDISRISERSVTNYIYLEDLLDDLDRNPPGGKTGCFIATAAYGSYSESHVLTLREFRDNVLSKSVFGRLFIRLYSKFSPPIARLIESREFAKKGVRGLLKPFVCMVRYLN